MPLSTEDRLDILDLYARYNHAIDDCDPDAFAACFTPEGVLNLGANVLSGHGDMRKFADRRHETRGWEARHLIGNVTIEPGTDADHAKGRAYVWLLDIGDSSVRGHGRYTDELARGAGGWAFTHRAIAR